MTIGKTKRFVSVLCALATLFLVSGCSHQDPTPSGPAPKAGSTPTEEASQSGNAGTSSRGSRPKLDTSQ